MTHALSTMTTALMPRQHSWRKLPTSGLQITIDYSCAWAT